MRAANFLVQALVFILCFTLEVTVHALTQEPTGCFARLESVVCALENDGRGPVELKLGSTVITLDEGSAVLRSSKNEVRLIKGTVWVRAGDKFRVRSEFGDFENRDSGDFWVSRTRTQVTASAISTTVLMNPRGSKESLEIAAGLKNFLGEIDFSGRAATGIPVAIAFKDHVARWARLYRGPKPEFEAAVGQFHQQWVQATHESAELNQTLFNRVIASVDEQNRQIASKAEAAAKENRELRELFRRKALGGD